MKLSRRDVLITSGAVCTTAAIPYTSVGAVGSALAVRTVPPFMLSKVKVGAGVEALAELAIRASEQSDRASGLVSVLRRRLDPLSGSATERPEFHHLRVAMEIIAKVEDDRCIHLAGYMAEPLATRRGGTGDAVVALGYEMPVISGPMTRSVPGRLPFGLRLQLEELRTASTNELRALNVLSESHRAGVVEADAHERSTWGRFVVACQIYGAAAVRIRNALTHLTQDLPEQGAIRDQARDFLRRAVQEVSTRISFFRRLFIERVFQIV